MNKLQIPSTGFPGTTESWKFVANAYEEILGQLGLSFSSFENVIVAGVLGQQGSLTNGLIAYQGELMPFVGGANTGTVVIMEKVTQATYNTDITNTGQLQQFDTYIKRYAKPGNQGDGIADFPYADLKRVKELLQLSQLTEQATESSKGVAAIATQAEVNAGTDDSKIVTAAKLQEKLNELLPDLSGYLEAKHIPAYNTGWAQNIDLPAVYYKDLQGMVHLEGLAARNAGNNQVIFTLPVGYRPNYDRVLPVSIKVDAEWYHSYITIMPNGDVKINHYINIIDSNGTGAGVAVDIDLVSLDGIFFRI